MRDVVAVALAVLAFWLLIFGIGVPLLDWWLP